MRRTHVIASALAITAAIAGYAAPAGAARIREEQRVLYATSFSAPAQLFGLGPSGCTNLNPDTGRCLLDFFQQDTISGDIVGQDTDAGSLSVQLPAFTGDAVSLTTFRGTVRGCPGPGTVVTRLITRLGIEPGQNIATTEVVPDSGSGGLATLEGTGQTDVTVHPDGTATGTSRFDFHCTEDR
jgi:Protein of unknown function (DUF3224)